MAARSLGALCLCLCHSDHSALHASSHNYHVTQQASIDSLSICRLGPRCLARCRVCEWPLGPRIYSHQLPTALRRLAKTACHLDSKQDVPPRRSHIDDAVHMADLLEPFSSRVTGYLARLYWLVSATIAWLMCPLIPLHAGQGGWFPSVMRITTTVCLNRTSFARAQLLPL